MKIYYIDSENTGVTILNEMKFTAQDRVFIFTNAASQKGGYANPLFTVISGYPSGKNQADFHLIAHLAKVLAYLTRTEKNVIELVLCSKDTQLWKAFEFQCTLAEIKASNPYIGPAAKEQTKPASSPEPVALPVSKASSPMSVALPVSNTSGPVPVAPPAAKASSSNVVVAIDTTLEAKVLKLTQQPITFTDLKSRLNVSQSALNTAFSKLLKDGKIQRQAKSKKHWVCVAKKLPVALQ